ncbi:MAG: CvpA family protein, partial [Armatimonadota bacterium]|nr:CvpA family protein [Armatimonadota bacterium]
TWIDWVVVGLVLLMILSGLQRGPVRALLESVFLLLAFTVTSLVYKPVTQALFTTEFPWPDWAAMFTFAGLLVVLVIVGNFLTAAIAGRKAATGVNILLGGIVGAAKGVLWGMVFLVFVLAAPFAPAVRQDVERSTFASYLADWQRGLHQAVDSLLPIDVPALGPGGEKF